jgi:ribonuclease VapC
VILDTSALVAILMLEPEASSFAIMIEESSVTRLSVANYLEAAILVERRGDAIRRAMFDTFIQDFGIRLEPVTVSQIHLAHSAYRLYGKGMHRAGLNYGDCFSYALARSTREPLLFKGNDFSLTDITPALTART